MSNIERTDNNVGSIDEDVKRCNELTKVKHANWIGISNQLAISHILAEREQKDKRILEMEEKMNADIMILIYELKQKDKQIDLMAKFIENNMSEKKIINEICIKSKCNNEECHEDDLKDCIKQCFERKVEDVKD